MLLAHSSPLTSPSLCVNVMAKDGEGAPWLQPFLGRHLYEVADAVIKADHWTSAVESSAPLDFLSLHATWTPFYV